MATASNDVAKATALRAVGAELVCLPDAEGGRISLPALLDWLGAQGVNELHVEAGPGLNGALAVAGLVDEYLIYLAPTLLGHVAQGMFDLPPLTNLSAQLRLKPVAIRMVGEDICLLARPLRQAWAC